MRILIAEDDVTSRDMLAAMLKKSGHEVVETRTGAEAWEVLQRPDAPELVILDWMMPEMEGLEVIQQVRARITNRPPHIIMLTTRSGKGDMVTALEAGADDYLTKPFDIGELRARIGVGNRIIEMRQQLGNKVQALQRAMNHINTLQGILPICMYCKKIRNDQGYWDLLETYIALHTEALFSHSICPDCMGRLHPEEDDKNNDIS